MFLPETARRFKVIIAGISALVLTVGLARFAYTPMLPIMHAQAGLSDLAGGWLATINYAGYMAGTLVAAMVADARRKFLMYRAGLVVALLGTAGMGLTTDMVAWGVLRFLAGVSGTAGLLFASGLVLNWLMRHGHRGELGLHFTGLGFGIAVSGVAVAVTSHGLPWDGQWIGLGVVGLLFFVPAWRWMPEPAPAAAASPAAMTAAVEPTPSRRWMWLMTAIYFGGGFGFAVSATFIVTIVGRLPALDGHASWVWVLVGLAATPASFVWDRVAASLGPARALMAAYGLQVLSTLLPAVTGNLVLNLLAAALFGITFVGIVSLTLTLVGRRFPANPAKAMARMTLSYGAAQIVAPALSGAIATASGSYRGALVLTAVILAIATALLQLARQEDARARA